MGIKPDEIPNENLCPLGPFAGGLEPQIMAVNVSGITKGASWTPADPEPPNGLWLLVFVSCGYWQYAAGDWVMSFIYNGPQITFAIQGPGAMQVFNDTIDIVDQFKFVNETQFPGAYGGDGIATGIMNLDGDHLPYEWLAGEQVGVPTKPGYFAEQFDSGIAEHRNRYACHRDGTNVKVYTDF